MFACKLLATALLFNLLMIFSVCGGCLYGRVVTCCLNVGVKIYDIKYDQSLHSGEQLQLLGIGGS